MSYTDKQLVGINRYAMHKLVCAIPGSGKTYMSIGLVEKILNEDTSAHVLLVTFTSAAASEMRTRLAAKLPTSVMKQRVEVATFASIMIRQARPLLGKRQLKIGASAEFFERKAIAMCGYSQLADRIQAQTAIRDASKSLERTGFSEAVDKLLATYDGILKKSNAIDLDGIVRELIAGLNSGTVEKHKATHIVVDEFQDTDTLQYTWLKLHGENGAVVTAVGDDDQSIYSWRQSSGYENMAELMLDFGIKPMVLDTCFRCPQEVLDVANKLIVNNEERIPKKLKSGLEAKGKVRYQPIDLDLISSTLNELIAGAEPESYQRDQLEHFQAVVNEKGNRVDQSALYVAHQVSKAPGEWTVLARTNKTLDTLEMYLNAVGVSVMRLGGKSIWENETLMLIVQVIYLMAVRRNTKHLASALFWSGEAEEVVSEIMQKAKHQGFLGVSDATEGDNWSEPTKALYELCKKAGNNEFSAQDIVTEAVRWVNECRIHFVGKANKKPSHAQKITENTNKMGDIAKQVFLSARGDIRSRGLFLEDKAFGKKEKKELSDREDQVVLCTMSSSKGLEFPRVWVHKVESNQVPSKISYKATEEEPQKPESEDYDLWLHSLCEERRLLYVATTRAEKEVVFSYREGHASGFLREMFGEQDFDYERPELLE